MAAKGRKNAPSRGFTDTVVPGSAEQAILVKQDAQNALLNAEEIVVLTSSAGAGGAATEVMVLTGLAVADTILSVTQKTKGANSLPLLGWSTQAANALTGVWSANPGAGSVIQVCVKRVRASQLANVVLK